MRIWWIIIGLLAGFNLLLALTWWQKSRQVGQAATLLASVPSLDEYENRSEQIARIFESSFARDRPVGYTAYVDATARFSQALTEWDRQITRAESNLFNTGHGPASVVQDSVWSAFQDYRAAVETIVESAVLPRRKMYDDYRLASNLIRRRRLATDLSANRYLMQRVDSVIHRYGSTAGYMMRDEAEDAFLGYLQDQSDPAVEHRTRTLIGRLNNLMMAPGTMSWYGTIYRLDTSTAAEQVGLCRQVRMLKGKVDEQLLDLVKP